MSQADAAIEVTDTDSAAQEIERRFNQAEEPEQVEEAEEESSEVAEESIEDEPETEQEEVAEQEPETEESEELGYENIDQLAEALEMSPEEFLEAIKVKRKIDGVEEEVTLAELRNGNQRDADYRRKTEELASQRREFEAESKATTEKYNQQLQEAAALAANLESQMMGEFNDINWNQLEIEDREEWLMQRQKFAERNSQVQAAKEQAKTAYDKQMQELQEQNQQQFLEKIQQENELLLTKVPEWSDAALRESEQKEMVDLLAGYGFSEAEVNEVSDHRLVVFIREALLNKGKTKQIEIAKKKVRTLPKMIKPGVKPDKSTSEKQAKREAAKRLRKGGHKIDVVADALMDRI